MPSFMIEYEHLKIQLKDIKLATNDFDEKNVIGHGGFGKVYKGELCHSYPERKSLVALKRLDRKYGQGDPQFWKEIMMLSRYRHENLISLLGFCNEEGEMILVYEYASGGSLERYLKEANLTWTERIKICLDASKGLRSLHEPDERNQRVLHCDIKSANILLDENRNAKVSDFGLSKMGSTYQHHSLIVTNVVGTTGYCDPLYMEEYQLTKESDVYSFGVVLFEVLCGRQCAELINGRLKVFVPFWKQCYEDKKLERIVLEGIKQHMNPSSLDIFAGIAYQCLHKDREQRPAMSLVVEKLEFALQTQMLPKEFVEIANAAVDPLHFRSLEEFKELLSKGVLLNGGKTWLSVNDKGEHHIINSIADYLSFDEPITDNPNTNYRARYSVEKKSRFAIGCYETELMDFKLHITTPLFLSPDITYRINLVFHYSEIENMKQQLVGVKYKIQNTRGDKIQNTRGDKIQGETTISIVHFADKKEDKQLVAELYEFTSNEESILDLEIFLEDCGLSGHFYIEGIEFRPMEKVEHQVVVSNKEIVADAAPPMLYRFTEESKALLPQGALVNNGTWLSINDKGELCVLISIKNCLIGDSNYKFYGHDYSLEKDSRFADGCYKADRMNFRIRVKTPLGLSPCVRYSLNLVFKHDNTEELQQQSFPVWYSLKGATKGEIMMSIVHLNDNRKDGWLVAELYQFTSDGKNSTLDLEFIFDSCGLWGNMFIEGIEFQPLGRVEQVVVAEYEEILKGVITPLYYRSAEELKVLLSKGILLERRMWFSINKKGQHIERIYIQACLNPDELAEDSLQHLSYDIVSSRFPGGLLYVYKNEYKARARAEYLSLQVSYAVNLVFRYKNQSDVNLYNHLRYKLYGEDETKVFTIYQTTPMREDGWFIAPLHYFTSQNTTADVQFEFEDRHTELLIAGIEFQPLEENVEQVFEEYKNIVEASSQSLFYTSLDELKQILSNGVHLNEYKLWFSLNEKGEHCELISMEDCLIPNAYFPSQYKSHWCSRFPAGLYQTHNKGFRTHVKTQQLSPKITYTVNLVIHGSSSGKQEYVGLEYTLRGEITSTVYLAKRIDEDFYMAELYQFISDGGIVDLEIDFDNPGANIEFVEGILFQPLDTVEDPVSEDDKVEDIQTISHSGILNLSNSTEKKTRKKNLCSPLRKWFQFNNDTAKEWSYLDKSGKKCFMLSARAACSKMKSHFTWRTLPESRFGEVLVITAGREFKLVSEINPILLSPDTTYVCYFVYKLPQQQYIFQPPLKVSNRRGETEDYDQYIYSYLVSPPNTPVIGQKFDENNYNPLNRHNLSALPRQRSDGWMEVKVWDFQTKKTPKTVWMNLKLEHPVKKDLSGLIVHGIEIR